MVGGALKLASIETLVRLYYRSLSNSVVIKKTQETR